MESVDDTYGNRANFNMISAENLNNLNRKYLNLAYKCSAYEHNM